MNIWLARLGGDENLPIDKFQTLLRMEFRFSDDHNLNLFEYRAEGVDYVSFDLTPPGSGKLHNHVSDENELTSYSGLLVGTKSGDRKSTRLNSSHVAISYAVFCLKTSFTSHKF